MIAAVGLLALAAGLSGGGAAAVLVGCAVAGVGYGAAQSLTLVSAFARTGLRGAGDGERGLERRVRRGHRRSGRC